MKIKVLTVKQPWAHLIVNGYRLDDGRHEYKPVENRSWKTDYRGQLYIHTSKQMDWEALEWLEWERKAVAMELKKHFKLQQAVCCCRNKLHPDTLDQFGAIIGRVELVDCVRNHPSEWAEAGMWHWVLRNPTPIVPIPARGQLQLWEYDAPLIETEYFPEAKR